MGHISNSESFRLNISSTWKQRSYAPTSQYFKSYTTAYALFNYVRGAIKKFFNKMGAIISYGVIHDFAERYKVNMHIYHGAYEEYIVSRRNKFNRIALSTMWNPEQRKIFKNSRPGGFGQWRNSYKWYPTTITRTNERWGNKKLPKKFQPKAPKFYVNYMQKFMKMEQCQYALTLLKSKKLSTTAIPNNNKKLISPVIKPLFKKTKKRPYLSNYAKTKKLLAFRRKQKYDKLIKKSVNKIVHAPQLNARFSIFKKNGRIRHNATKMRLGKKLKWYLTKVYLKQMKVLDAFRRNYRPLLQLIETDLTRMIKKEVEVKIKYIAARNVDSATMSRFVRVRLEQFDTFNEIVFPMIRHMRKITKWTGFMMRVAGRINRQQRASFNEFREGRVAFGTYAYPLDFTYDIAILKYGVASIRIWISRGFKKQEGAMNKSYFKFQTI